MSLLILWQYLFRFLDEFWHLGLAQIFRGDLHRQEDRATGALDYDAVLNGLLRIDGQDDRVIGPHLAGCLGVIVRRFKSSRPR